MRHFIILYLFVLFPSVAALKFVIESFEANRMVVATLYTMDHQIKHRQELLKSSMINTKGFEFYMDANKNSESIYALKEENNTLSIYKYYGKFDNDTESIDINLINHSGLSELKIKDKEQFLNEASERFYAYTFIKFFPITIESSNKIGFLNPNKRKEILNSMDKVNFPGKTSEYLEAIKSNMLIHGLVN